MSTPVEPSWDGWFAFAIASTLRTTLLLAIVGIAYFFMKRRLSAASRHLLLMAAAAGSLLLPAASHLLPAWELPILGATRIPLPAAGPAPVAEPSVSAPTTPISRPVIPSSVTRSVIVARLASREIALPNVPRSAWILCLWLIGALACGLRVLTDLALLRRLSRNCPSVPHGPLKSLVAELAQASGLRRSVELRQSREKDEAIVVPVTWGARKPCLLLPPTDILDGWPDERLRAVLLHELAHIRRGDWTTKLVVRVVCALYWFHPLAWLLARQIERDSEQACDDQVLTAGVRSADYAAHLLELTRLVHASRVPAMRIGSAQAVTRSGSAIHDRMSAILDTHRDRRSASRHAVFITIAALIAVLGPLACARPAARAAGPLQLREHPAQRDIPGGARNLDFRKGLEGWSTTANGDNATPNPYYAVGIDPVVQRNGVHAAFLQSSALQPEGYGALRQDASAKPYRGRRIRLSGYLKTEGIRDYAGFMLSLLDTTSDRTWAMAKHPILGTTDWRRYEYVVDVPKDCRMIMIGASMKGPGKVWASEYRLEFVGREVPVTQEAPEVSSMSGGETAGSDWPLARPSNLDFAEGIDEWAKVEESDGSRPTAYHIGLDEAVRRDGRPAPYLTSDGSKPSGYGTMVQYVRADAYRGKRIRLRGMLRTAGVKKHAGLWLAIQQPGWEVWDGEKQPIRGDTDWTEQSIVVDVPRNAGSVGYGIMVHGVGKVWASNLRIEVVDRSTPVTRPTLKE